MISPPSTPRSIRRSDLSQHCQNNTHPHQHQYHHSISDSSSSLRSSPSSSPTDTEALWTPPLQYRELDSAEGTSISSPLGLSEKTPTQATFRGLGLAGMHPQTVLYTAGPSAPSSGVASGSSSRRTSIRGTLAAEAAARRVSDDDGLVMRDRSERDGQGSVGRAGGVDVGVTRPKRRLSR